MGVRRVIAGAVALAVVAGCANRGGKVESEHLDIKDANIATPTAGPGVPPKDKAGWSRVGGSEQGFTIAVPPEWAQVPDLAAYSAKVIAKVPKSYQKQFRDGLSSITKGHGILVTEKNVEPGLDQAALQALCMPGTTLEFLRKGGKKAFTTMPGVRNVRQADARVGGRDAIRFTFTLPLGGVVMDETQTYVLTGRGTMCSFTVGAPAGRTPAVLAEIVDTFEWA